MFEHKNKIWYKGVFIISFLILVIPLIFSLIFYFTSINMKINQSLELTKNTSKFLGCCCGLLFDGTCIISGLFKGTLKVVFNRIKEFFLDLRVSFKFAISNYWFDLKENGFMFWILFILIGSTVYFTCDSLINIINILN